MKYSRRIVFQAKYSWLNLHNFALRLVRILRRPMILSLQSTACGGTSMPDSKLMQSATDANHQTSPTPKE